MKNNKKHILNFSRSLVMGLFFAGQIIGANAASTGNGCDDENNVYINPTLALCSTHVYNIGDATNPSSGAERQLMQDVVALKTTMITQQMKKQYDFLDATVRRLRTQLQKAVLTTSLQAAGAAESSNSAAGFASDDKNVILPFAQNCMLMGSPSSALDCMQSNTRTVINAANAGNTADARRQLLRDLDVANTWGVISKNGDKWNGLSACDEMSANRRDAVLQCAQQLNVQLARYAAEQQKNTQQQRVQ